MPHRLSAILVYLIITSPLFGQNLYITNYTDKEFGSSGFSTSPQNWDIEQDSLGRLFIANSSGIILFDGTQWSMVQKTKDFSFNKLVQTDEGEIYASGENRFGYLSQDSLGLMVFNSLQSEFQSMGIVLLKINGLETHENKIYIIHDKGLIQYAHESIKQFPIQTELQNIDLFGGKITVQDDRGHILQFFDNYVDTLINFEGTLEPEMISLEKISDKQTLLFTKNSGVFEVSGKKLNQWGGNNYNYLSSLQIRDIHHYPDLQQFGIATRNEGVVFINYNGTVSKVINSNSGLESNTCYKLFQDKSNGLWVCMDRGFARIEFPASISYYNKDNGLNGVVSSMAEQSDHLYVGTTNGLYILEDNMQFKKAEINGEVWDIKEIDQIIWAATSSGIYQIVDFKPLLITDQSARTIQSSKMKTEIWVGLDEGLGIIEKKNNNWKWKTKIPGIDHEVRFVAEESDSVLWVSYEKVSRLVLNTDGISVRKIETMTEKNGFSNDFYITESYKFHDDIYFGTGLGVMRFNRNNWKFEHDLRYGMHFLDSLHFAWAMAEDKEQNVWITSNGLVGKTFFEENEVAKWDTISFSRIKNTDIWRTVPAEEYIYFCATDGLYKYDKRFDKNLNTEYYSIINKIEINRDSIVSNLIVGEHIINVASLPFSSNDIRFNYTATTYNYDEQIRFSFILEGYDERWSSWIPESSKEYTNLPPGEYKFKVKAKNLYGIDSKITAYPFDILPPWYRTYWAYAIGILILITGGIGIERIQRKRLFKRQQAKIKIQQRKLEQEREISNKLRKVDKLKDDFLANTSHELRTPLNGIIGISESLYEECKHTGNKETSKNLSLVISSGKRLASLVDSILDYSKLKTENLDIRIKDIDLKSVVEIVISMSKPLISDASIHLKNAIPDNFSLVKADENRLQQILYNLVGNAIKFSEQGTIAVEAKALDSFVEISVKDEGIGIPGDKLDDIFESYEQLESNISREYIGTGLGLTVSKKLVELHGGKMSVTSTPGKGSIFKFTIPRAKNFANKEDTQKNIDTGETTDLNSKILVKNAQFDILIVDDEPINRQVITNHLKNEPYNLYLVSNGAEALKLIENQKFDLVLLDVMMPRMSGFEVCVKIREKYLISELPIIFITAKDQIMDLVEGFTYGGNDYLTKPFSKQEFMARIKTHLNLIKVNDSYSRFIPFEFLRSLGRESIIDVNLGDQIEKEVTVVFSDIRDYTTISESMSPKENFEFLNSFLGEMGPVIQKNHGFVMQYLGDGLMSIFLNSPDNAVAAASEMLRQTFEYNNRKELENHGEIKIGIGIHTGKLIFGVIGDKKRMSVNVVSDTVNTASRMEGLTKHYGASNIISENTLDQLKSKDDINHRFLGLVKVKGKSNPLKIYEILDGLEGVEGEKKISTKEVFENGLANYFNRDFINAASEFKKVVTLNPTDLSAQMYLKLAAKYMVEIVPENWTGVETMMLK